MTLNQNRKALLVYPKFPDNSFWNFHHINGLFMFNTGYGTPKAGMPPLGLLSIAPVLAEHYGRENIRLIDLNYYPLDDEDIQWADDVYLSGMLTQQESYDQVAAMAKKYGKNTIGGGPYVSETTPNLDVIFINEADITIHQFIEDFIKGEVKPLYKPDRKPLEEEFLIPDYSYLNLNNYTTMAVQFSRGCPHDCDFCDITQRYGRKMRTKAVENVIRELDQLYEMGWRSLLMFIDDNFIGKPGEAYELVKELEDWQKKHNYPYEFFTQASVLLAEKQFEPLLTAMAPAGFSMVFLGIESPNEESLHETNKSFNLRKGMTLVEKIKRIQEVGRLMILGGFIVGFDSDKSDIFDMQIEFIEKIALPNPMVTILQPLPDTRLQSRLHSENRLVGVTKGDVAGATAVAFRPKHMSDTELITGYKKILEKVYLDMDSYYSRCWNSLTHILAKKNLLLSPEGIYGLFRIIWVQGFKSNYKLSFWKYFLKAVFRYPKKLEFAMRWSAYGLHYNRLATKLINDKVENIVC